MKFTKIRLQGTNPFDFPIVGASITDPYILKNVDGLGPPGVDVYLSQSAQQGALFQGRRPQDREIVMRIGLNPDYSTGQTPSDLRTALYELLNPANPQYLPPPNQTVLSGVIDRFVDIQIMDGTTQIMHTPGYIKTFEAVTFSQDPEVQITLSCPESYFRGEAQDLTPTNDGDYIHYDTSVGDARMYPYFEYEFPSDTPVFQITGFEGNSVTIEYAFLAGDILKYNAEPGSRSATLHPAAGGGDVDLLTVSPDGIGWMYLDPGVNRIASGYTSDFNVFTYIPKYWGV